MSVRDASADILDILAFAMSKVLVSFDDALLRRIDRVARSRGLTRSAYLAQLAERDAAQALGPGKTPSVRAALRELDRLFAAAPAGESTAAIRAARDAR
jgi:DNA-binding phage protein